MKKIIILSAMIIFSLLLTACDLSKILGIANNEINGTGDIIVNAKIPANNTNNITTVYGVVANENGYAISGIVHFDFNTNTGDVSGAFNVIAGTNRTVFVNFIDKDWNIIRHVEYNDIEVKSDQRFVLTLTWKD